MMNHTRARCNFKAAFRVIIRPQTRDLDRSLERSRNSRRDVAPAIRRCNPSPDAASCVPVVLLAPTFDRGFVRMSFHQKAHSCSAPPCTDPARERVYARAREYRCSKPDRCQGTRINQLIRWSWLWRGHSSTGVSLCAPWHADNANNTLVVHVRQSSRETMQNGWLSVVAGGA